MTLRAALGGLLCAVAATVGVAAQAANPIVKRKGVYYFMWSEGGWTGPDYRVVYAMYFNDDGTIRPVVMTNEGVAPRSITR